MKIAGLRLVSGHACALVGMVYAYGTFLGTIGLVWSWFWDRGMPQLQWGQFLLAPFAIGVTALALEGLGSFCGRGFTLGHTESWMRLAAGKIVIVILLLALHVGWPMYQISQ